MRRASLLVMCLILALPATAQVYQWRDAQGRINYSDTPPPSGPAKTVKGAPRSTAPSPDPSADAGDKPADQGDAQGGNGQASDGASTDQDKTGAAKAEPAKPKTMAEKETEFRQRRVAAAEAEAKAEKERQQTAERNRNCEQARNELLGLKAGRRVARFNDRGQREVLDEAERSAEIERAQRFLDQNCK